MSGPEVAVGAVLLGPEGLLLVRRGHGPAAGTWSVPGGRVHAGETLHEAVIREVAEETGLQVVVDRFLGWVERMDHGPPPTHFVILDFEVTALDPEVDPVAGDDAAEVDWLPLDALSDVRLAPGLLDALEDWGVLDTAL